MSENTVTLAHGAGGRQTSELIEKVFKAHFSNPEFTADDAAVLPKIDGRLGFTTDGFIVSPNITVSAVETFDLGFENSDHNPVLMTVNLST